RPEPEAILELLHEREIAVTTWDGWYNLDAAERALGEADGRERKKIVEWDQMLFSSHPEYEI
ncbi:MAG TPA: pyridine nucleotide-disulfide oxidoreductase, partial [Corynebacterium sp.]|nr:pyridine nucleotide-disulfide oxidoreductase [Corynebacterium sp.]